MAADWAGKNEDEVKKLAYSSVYQLQLHIHYLHQVFDLADSFSLINYPNHSLGNGTKSKKLETVASDEDCEPMLEFENRVDFAEDEDFLQHFQ